MSLPVAPAVAPLLSVRRLSVRFARWRFWPTPHRLWLRALDSVDLNLKAGETLGILGESGSGKTTLARCLVGLQTFAQGSIRFNGTELLGIDDKSRKAMSGDIQMVFQDARGALNPRLSALKAVEAPLKALRPQLTATQRESAARDMLRRVGLSDEVFDARPKALSGGQALRVTLARALVVEPKLLICDEPTAALDASVQAQILNLLLELQQAQGLALILISHDQAVIRHLSQRVLVMYAGRVIEQADAAQLFDEPAHPYTQRLIAAAEPAPAAEAAPEPAAPTKPTRKQQRQAAQMAADRLLPALGCRFRGECPVPDEICTRESPQLRRVLPGSEHFSACHFARPELPPPEASEAHSA